MALKILSWNQSDVENQVKQKVADALNMTAADAVGVAMREAPRLTGFMANTIEVVKEATPDNCVVTWGNVTASYTIWQEIGFKGRPGRYFLRRGAEEAYSNLKGYLARD